MSRNWLDHWDERRARRGERAKGDAHFELRPDLAFPKSDFLGGLSYFCTRAEWAAANPSYYGPAHTGNGFVEIGDFLTFPSSVKTDVAANNLVTVKLTQSSSRARAVVVFHHWNAKRRAGLLAGYLARSGLTVAEVALPYHLERSRPGATHADFMLSASLGRTLQSFRQAVADGRDLIRWLQGEGYSEISVLGMSLGSWVAGLVAAHEPGVRNAALCLSAGSLADMVWTGRATRNIRAGLEPHLDLPTLRRAWAPLDLEAFADRLCRNSLDLQITLAKRDTVVRPELSESFIESLRAAGGDPEIRAHNCGHYSLSLPPFGPRVAYDLRRFLAS
ncbi:RcgR family putative quorum lactone hydrolase [Paracoccus laeviglucosivorans]|uniref:RcgR family putative quorum lactone hydrolase n=1 Tax=Paracoccus laeviglucosivorans TaxID=1197861 RepID=UPI00115C2DF1|nr:alpha/beta hydrolase family protein [Paracoccus laeviglucosivorans]